MDKTELPFCVGQRVRVLHDPRFVGQAFCGPITEIATWDGVPSARVLGTWYGFHEIALLEPQSGTAKVEVKSAFMRYAQTLPDDQAVPMFDSFKAGFDAALRQTQQPEDDNILGENDALALHAIARTIAQTEPANSTALHHIAERIEQSIKQAQGDAHAVVINHIAGKYHAACQCGWESDEWDAAGEASAIAGTHLCETAP